MLTLEVCGLNSGVMQMCIFCPKKLYLDSTGVCGGGWMPQIFFSFLFCYFQKKINIFISWKLIYRDGSRYDPPTHP